MKNRMLNMENTNAKRKIKDMKHNVKSELIPVYHETCINHELKEVMNTEIPSNQCAYEVHIKCLKGHNLFETNPKCCKDYDLTNEPFGWKLHFMQQIVKDMME